MTTLSIREFEALFDGEVHSVDIKSPHRITLCVIKNNLPSTRRINLKQDTLWLGDEVVREITTWKLESSGLWQPNGWTFYSHPPQRKVAPEGYCIELLTEPPSLWEKFIRYLEMLWT